MAKGFIVTEFIPASPAVEWKHLTDFKNAKEWMSGVDFIGTGLDAPVKVGTVLKFVARGKQRETRVTALQIDKKLSLTSTQGGVAKRDR